MLSAIKRLIIVAKIAGYHKFFVVTIPDKERPQNVHIRNGFLLVRRSGEALGRKVLYPSGSYETGMGWK